MPLGDLVWRAIEGGVDHVQIRDKDLDENELIHLIESIIENVPDRSRLLVNGNLAVAQRLKLGLHLPESGQAPTIARERLGPCALIGRSIHSAAAIPASEGADYLMVGHVFPSTSKPGLAPLGIDGLATIVAATSLPVIAVGGISAENVYEVMATGAHGVAVISAINLASQPEQAARAIAESIRHYDRKRLEEEHDEHTL